MYMRGVFTTILLILTRRFTFSAVLNVCFVSSQSARHFIMQVVCEATQSSDTQVRVAALQCLVKIMSLYYQFMEHYMGPALFAVSINATSLCCQ